MKPRGQEAGTRAHDDESWRRSTLITQHMDHPPQVKALVDELYETLSGVGTLEHGVGADGSTHLTWTAP